MKEKSTDWNITVILFIREVAAFSRSEI